MAVFCRMRLARFAPSLLALFLAPPIAPAASAQTIAGLVVDSATRRPARLLAVRVLGDSGQTVADTRTDTAGVFYASLTKGGVYRLHFALDSASGFESDTIRVPDDSMVQRQFVVSFPRAYFEFEVEKQVQTMRGSAQPQYPADLRAMNIEGVVLAQFVVDTTGRAEMRTFKVLKASHGGFVEAVRDVVPRMRFHPAEIHGHRVRQMVQQPFEFRLTGFAPPTDWLPPLRRPSPPQ